MFINSMPFHSILSRLNFLYQPKKWQFIQFMTSKYIPQMEVCFKHFLFRGKPDLSTIFVKPDLRLKATPVYPNDPQIVTPPWQLCNALMPKQAALVWNFFY